MIIVDEIDDPELHRYSENITKIGEEALSEVKKENHRLKIPLVYSIGNRIYYVMPDGKITMKSPFS
jgi:hypothetical protein